ncbi:hypothetical protein CDD81_2888 [Ophiocordyceps australis]|uniref:Rhodopsin domain-containing protein n=1 Tax=Ophiocordyceps australis TaxID=1399860 RepID=A0A2C5XVQ7_9HYPO|nr:hypothetical protein CDD81_2888 [Ophiocordyceps australis]
MPALASNPDLTPALAPPPGVISNLVDPPSQGYATIIAMVLYMVIATPCVAARLYTRARIHRKLWWDDWSSVIALIGLYGFCVIPLVGLRYGFGTDEWNVSQTHVKRFNTLFSAIEIVARISIFFTKLSILLLYIRYFCPPGARRTWIFWSTLVVIIFNALYCIALVLVIRLQCVGKPPAVVESGTCVNHYLVLVTASIINVVTDFLILLIPLIAVWHLRMPQRRKLGLLVVFAVGGLGCAASIARLGYQVPEASNPNQTIILTNVTLLALAEHVIGIVVGCMPLFPALYRHMRSSPQPSESHNWPRSTGSRWKRAFGRQSSRRRPDHWGSVSALVETERTGASSRGTRHEIEK